MLGRSAGLLAIGALGASAFLIPAGIDLPKTASGDASWLMQVQSESRLVRLPCSACAFSSKQEKVAAVEDDIVFEIQGGAKDILLNYTVSTDGETLLLNGEPLYRMSESSLYGFTHAKHHVEQVPSSALLEDILLGEVKGTQLEVVGSGVTASRDAELENGDMMTRLRNTIFALGDGQAIVDVELDAVLLDLVRPKDGRLTILSVEVQERPQTKLPPPPYPKGLFGSHGNGIELLDGEERLVPGASPVPGPERGHHSVQGDCGSLPPAICKLRKFIQGKISGMRKGGCPSRKGGKFNGPPHNGELPSHIKAPHFPRPHFEGPPGPPEGRPHHFRPHGPPHRGHHHHHRFHGFHVFMHGFAAILLPTLAGVAVGIAISLVGLVVGRLISFVWIYVVRGGRRGYASVSLDDDVEAEGQMSKESFESEDRESLPAYEHAPVYENAPAYEEVEKGAQ